jgi:hypothetical protein
MPDTISDLDVPDAVRGEDYEEDPARRGAPGIYVEPGEDQDQDDDEGEGDEEAEDVE